MKRFQNKIAESRRTLPITILYGVGIWLLAGLTHQGWWFQFACFFASVYSMIHLNNINLLIRVYSRSVSVFFILLCCSACWLFPSTQAATELLCTVLSLLLLFSCYQNQDTMGRTFYIFLLISLVSLLEPHFLLFVPIYIVLMATTVYSLGIRTFFATLIGLITPYWLYAGWLLYLNRHQPEMVLTYFKHFTEVQWNTDYAVVSTSQWAYLGLLIVLFIVGTIHFWITSYMDKIRVRQIYSSFIMLAVYTIILMAIQPQKYDMFISMMTIAVTPISAHFFTLTRTRISNIFFIVTIATILFLTGMNLWTLLSVS
jgi:hypothetical protein